MPPCSWAHRRAARLVSSGAAATAMPSTSSTRLPTLSATSAWEVGQRRRAGEVAEPLSDGVGHVGSTASGRTGEPVAPKMLSGTSTKVNSAWPAAASGSRSIASTM